MDGKNLGLLCGCLLVGAVGCAHKAEGEVLLSRSDGLPVGEGCGTADFLTFPVPQADYLPGSYAGRRFLNPDEHVGEDGALPEGTPVRAIGNGIIRVYRAASGYGELVVGIEHDLGRETAFRNGNGEIVSTRYALSIYGHLRRSQDRGGAELGWEEGDCVEVGEVIGYVNDDRHNGDGDTHLHGGFRLQSAADAAAADNTWFRGYDEDDGRWRGNFAAMSEAISGILITVSHHQDGSLIKLEDNPDIYLIEGGRKCLIRDETVWRAERFWVAGHPDGEWHKVAIVSDDELDCYPEGSEMAEGVRRRLIRCRDGDFLWREDNGNRQWIPVNGDTRSYQELVRSWGFEEGEIEWDEQFCGSPESFDPLYLRDGTLVREDDRSDVYFITAHGAARPIESWDLFIAMGYQANDIQWLPGGALVGVVREIQRDRLIGWDEARDCLAETGDQGGGGVDCSPAAESCNGVDDDCDGLADNGFDLGWDEENCGECGRRCAEDEICMAGECAYECIPTGEELCNDWDDDCDGEADEGFDLEGDRDNCGECRNRCVVNEECHSGSCRPLPHSELCNNRDDDYDGVADDFSITCETACGEGTQTCVGGNWGECTSRLPRLESCNGEDDDCDGQTDESLTLDCATDCGEGIQTCSRGAWGACSARLPSDEICNGFDDDCDGIVDEGLGCGQVCNPFPEACNGVDDDCDGEVDEELGCGGELHTVRVRFCPGENGSLTTDLPDFLGWYYYALDRNGCIDITWEDVREGAYRMNGEYQGGTAWECNEWPRGTVWLRNGEVPQAWVDGVEADVTYGHEERLDVGCNFFLTVD